MDIALIAHINPDHQLRLKLPPNTGTGPAHAIVPFDSDPAPATRGNLDDFLERLPRNAVGRPDHTEIVHRIEEDRVGWGET